MRQENFYKFDKTFTPDHRPPFTPQDLRALSRSDPFIPVNSSTLTCRLEEPEDELAVVPGSWSCSSIPVMWWFSSSLRQDCPDALLSADTLTPPPGASFISFIETLDFILKGAKGAPLWFYVFEHSPLNDIKHL